MQVFRRYVSGEWGGPSYSPLGIFFATKAEAGHRGDALIDNLIESVGGEWLELEPLRPEDYLLLGSRLFQLYAQTYGLSITPDDASIMAAYQDLRDQRESGLTRYFIKRVIATLDSIYGPPNAKP